MEFSNWAPEAEETIVASNMPTLVLVNREDDLVNNTTDSADGSREFPVSSPTLCKTSMQTLVDL